MGLLDFTNTPEGMQGLALLAAAGPSMQPMNFASRLAMAGDTYRGLLSDQLKQKLAQAQIDNVSSEAATRQATLEAARRKQAALPGLFSSAATPAGPGQLGSGTFGITPTAPGQPAIPAPAAPTLNWQAALGAGYTPDEIQKLDALRNVGLNKVARTVKATGPDNREYEYQMDEFGRPVGAPMAQYRAPISVNRGNSTDYIDPYTLQPKASFSTFQSPDSAASVAAAIRGQNLTDARAREQLNQGKTPAGYRQMPNGDLQAIPGGPADLKLQGALNQDTQALNSSLSAMDRLATAANELKNAPGLQGITGLRGIVPNVPGGAAANAEALLNTLKSQVAFGVLQDMRNNSKTGGALGSVSDAEGKRLEANLAALEKAQSYDQFQSSLQKIIDYANGAKDRLREAYNLKHDGRTGPAASALKPQSVVRQPTQPVSTPSIRFLGFE